MTATHRSPYGGTWYPGDPAELGDLLERLSGNSVARTGEFLLPGGAAFVVPHAGLVYSGTVALAAYRHLEQQPPETVVILGFAHRGSRPGIWIPEVDQISTPLGNVAIDHSLGNRLLESQAFQRAPEAQLCDHSVEIQLPLIQKVAPKARVLPLYAGSMDSRTRRRAAEALAPLIGNGTVLVASSDLTHYGRDFRFQPFPADSHTAEHLRELDTSVMNAAGSLDAPFFLSTLEETGATVCGRSPISLLLETLSLTQGEEFFQEILDYQTSGEITGEVHHSVSYGALGYFPAPAFHLDRAEQRLLLGSARGTLERYQKTGKRLRVPPEVRTPALMRKAAAFVSLHRRGELRGCVGHRAAFQPLFDAIPELTLSAAIDDSRFEAVAGDEQDIDIEISVLSPMKRIASPGLFQVGRHGAYLESGARRGLLLPQVAQSMGWTAEQFLAGLARKAGVSPRCYQDSSTRLFVFQAQVFGEHPVIS